MDLLEEARLALLAQRARLGSHGDADRGATCSSWRRSAARAALGLGDERRHARGGEAGRSRGVRARARVDPTHDPVAAAVFSITGARDAIRVRRRNARCVRDGRLVSSRDGLADRLQSLGDALAACGCDGERGEMRRRLSS